MNEIWKKSRRFGSYAISSHGRIKRLVDKKGSKAGSIKSFGDNGNGYLHASLWENGKQTMVYPHHLVAEEFIGERPHGYDVNHKDRNKKNNCIENLEYISHKQNCHRSFRKTTSKLEESNIRRIKELYLTGLSQQAIANQFGVAQTTISGILIGRTHA